MAVETKFLRLPQPVPLGARIDGWRVCWLGGWTATDSSLSRDGRESETRRPACTPELTVRRYAPGGWRVREAEPWPTPRPLASALAESAPSIRTCFRKPCDRGSWTWAERLQVPLDYPAAALTVMLAGAIGRRAWIRPLRHDHWVVNPNLWGAIVGRSGVMKSPVLRAALGPLGDAKPWL